jgi:hypothetical protein
VNHPAENEMNASLRVRRVMCRGGERNAQHDTRENDDQGQEERATMQWKLLRARRRAQGGDAPRRLLARAFQQSPPRLVSPRWVTSDRSILGRGFRAQHCHNLGHATAGLTLHLMDANVWTPFEIGGPNHNDPE